MGLTRCASTAQDATQGGAWAADLSPKAAQLDRFANAACAHYADKAAPAQASGARLWADEVMLTPRQSATLARRVRAHYAQRPRAGAPRRSRRRAAPRRARADL